MIESDVSKIGIVYKVMARKEWEAACEGGVFHGSPDDMRDGFIHLSAGGQLAATLKKYFSGCAGLVLIAFDVQDLGAGLRWEASRGGALFPHFYGPLSTMDALWTRDVELARDGEPIIAGDIA